MNDIVFRENIKVNNGDYNIGVIFIFDDYKESDFLKDLEFVKNYQAKKEFSNDSNERKYEVDMKFYKNIPFDSITFNYFKESLAIFAKFFFHTLKTNQHLITSTEFNLQLRLRRVPNGEWYFSYGDEDNISDAENACFYLSGIWLIGNIIIPRSVGSADYSIVQRYMLHELIHHKDKIEGNNFFEKNNHYSNKIKKLYTKKSAYFLNCLYNSLFNLREEGLADFNARKENPMDMSLEAIKKYNNSLIILSTLRKKTVSENYYLKNVGYENLTPTGEYANGRNICLTIALAIAKQKNRPFIVSVNGAKIPSTQININNALHIYNTIYFSNIDRECIVLAIQKINPLGHYYFLKEYENACDILGIKEEYRIMTRRRFYDIIHNAIEDLKKEKIGRLTKSGFRYAEPDIKDLASG